MGLEVIGGNLRRLREARGMTQDHLAQAANLSRVGYRNIETQKSLPRVDTLKALSDALGVRLEELVSPIRYLSQVRFRSLRRINSREQILMDVGRWLQDFSEIEEILDDHPVCNLSNIELPKEKAGLVRAKKAAAAVRQRFGLNAKEPVQDICGLLESEGIKVFSIQLAANDFFGLSVGVSDGGPAIVVNTWERISVERWIFTAAHELGHLVLHLKDYDVSQLSEDQDHEQEANVFAAHFLMPEEVFLREWEETAGMALVERVLKVKRIFKVSYKTVLYRLAERINQKTNVWQLFQSEYRRQSGRTLLKEEEPQALAVNDYQASFPESSRASEPDVLSPRDFRGDRLSRLVRKGVETRSISLSRGAEILRIPLGEMRLRANSWV